MGSFVRKALSTIEFFGDIPSIRAPMSPVPTTTRSYKARALRGAVEASPPDRTSRTARLGHRILGDIGIRIGVRHLIADGKELVRDPG